MTGNDRNSENDEKLVRRLRARDSQVMSEIYERFGKLVFSVIFSVVHERSRAEDLTQETFVRVWNRAHEFEGSSELLGRWVLAIARNRAIDHIRSLSSRMERKTSDLDTHGHHQMPFASANPEREVTTADDARILRGAVSRLNPNQQQVIQLAYYEGLSQTEIASQLGQPLGTVKSWCRVALKNLRDQMDPVVPQTELRPS